MKRAIWKLVDWLFVIVINYQGSSALVITHFFVDMKIEIILDAPFII